MKIIKIKASDLYGTKYIHVILLQVNEVTEEYFCYYIA